jgi:sec-independent protein translocase protein TatC
MAKKNLNEMSFFRSSWRFRWLLVRSTLAIVIMAFATYFFSDYLFDTIIFWSGTANIYNLSIFCDLSQSLLTDSFCITEFPLSSRIPPWRDR